MLRAQLFKEKNGPENAVDTVRRQNADGQIAGRHNVDFQIAGRHNVDFQIATIRMSRSLNLTLPKT
jgi:hypothetical protein